MEIRRSYKCLSPQWDFLYCKKTAWYWIRTRRFSKQLFCEACNPFLDILSHEQCIYGWQCLSVVKYSCYSNTAANGRWYFSHSYEIEQIYCNHENMFYYMLQCNTVVRKWWLCWLCWLAKNIEALTKWPSFCRPHFKFFSVFAEECVKRQHQDSMS